MLLKKNTMKNTIILLLVFFLISCNDDNPTSNTEIEIDTNPYIGNVILTTQLEVDDFGVMNYTSISGDLTIKQPQNAYESNINDLSKLQTLTSIGWDLVIMYNYNLKNLNGLNNISNVGRDLNIYSNRYLISMSGLEKLTTINEILDIYGNERLKDFCALTRLLKNNGVKGTYSVSNNSFNPSKQDIIDGNCSK